MKSTTSLLFTLTFLAACSSPKIVRKISSADYPAEATCEEKISYGKSDVQKCHLSTSSTKKSFYLFRGEGTIEEIQYAQGYLLAEQIDHGSIEEMLGFFEKEMKNAGKSRWLLGSLKECQMKRLVQSTSPELLSAIKGMAHGYADGMKAKGLTPQYTEDDFVFSLLGIEVANILTGIAQEKSEKPVAALSRVFAQCGMRIAGNGLKELLKGSRKIPAHERKMGCVGLIAPDSATGQGLIHGRNLDQSPLMKSWSKAPVIYLIKETGYIPYVAAGTAGLIYPGGISGFNQHGISVSLHQMNSTRWDSKHKDGTALVVPYLQQKILREAKTIDEAFEIIKKANVFSSWTIFIADSKNQDVASIEISANKKVIARRHKNEVMGQSNHYLSPDMQKEHFHANTAAYLETQSRLLQVEKVLNESKGRIDVDWAMETLASHIDYFEGERSFGRTAVKLSNIMSSIAHPARQEFWMTIGDKKPAAHSWYVGTKVDFATMQLDLISMNKSFKLDSYLPLEESYSYAVEAFKSYKAHENQNAIDQLKRALKLAEQSGKEDTSSTYNISRLYMMEKNYPEAKNYMDKLLPKKQEFHPYSQGLIAMYSARLKQLTEDNSADIPLLYKEAESQFTKIQKESKYGHGVANLKKKLKLISKWSKGQDAAIPALDFAVND